MKIKNNKNQLHNLTLFLNQKTEKNGDMTDEILENIAKKSTFKNKHEILLIDFNKLKH